MTVSVEIVECDHLANAFWNLGIVTHEVPPQALFDSLPDEPCNDPETGIARCPESCFIVDLLDEKGNVVTDKEISRELAQTLLDEPIEVLRDRFRQSLWETTGATG